MITALHELETMLKEGRYAALIEVLDTYPELNIREACLLGVALLRTGQFKRCEHPLASAMARGEPEASVEYGNLLRATNQNARAVKHYEKLMPTLSGELWARALRWYGVALYSLGDHRSVDMVEEARLAYLALGENGTAARISHTLAAMHFTRGEFREAKHLLDAALPTLEHDLNRRPLLNAYNTLIDLQLECGQLQEASETIYQAGRIASELQDEYAQLHVDARRASLVVKTGDYGSFVGQLASLRHRAEQLGEMDVYTFASNNLANHLSRTGQHAAALRVLAELSDKTPDRTLETRLVSAMLMLRRGDAPGALGQFLELRTQATRMGSRRDRTRALLLAALAAYHMHDLTTALTHLTEALGEVAGWPAGQVQMTLRQELQELEELLAHARLTPELRPVITAALEHTTFLIGSHDDDLFTEAQLLELNVLGPAPVALLNGTPCELRLPYSLPILTYLSLQPERSRQEITADLWGDHDPKKAAYSFRQCLVEIRRACGPDVIVMSGPHQEPRYALSRKVAVYLDSQRVLQLVAQGDVAAAINVYKGPFLARITPTEWVQAHQDQLVQSLTLSLRSAVKEALLRGDDRRVVILTTAILSIDPEDLEMEELRLEKAQQVASPVEVARLMAERNRRLN